MSFVSDILDPTGTISAFSGKTGAEASQQAAQLQAQSGREALAELQRSKQEGLGFLQPFGDVGLSGVAQADFLTDPNAQFDFLQNNPLFQLSLEQGQQATQQAQGDLFKSAAARGRLSSGDTLQQIQQLGDISQRNALLSGTNLIQGQRQSIGDLLNFGQGIASNQANTALGVGSQASGINTGIGNALASGQVGAANAQAQGASNIAQLAGTALSFFSDPKLKQNMELIGEQNGYNVYTWDWNDTAEAIGLTGSSSGVMADEVKLSRPDAITVEGGFMKVDYNAIGVCH